MQMALRALEAACNVPRRMPFSYVKVEASEQYQEEIVRIDICGISRKKHTDDDSDPTSSKDNHWTMQSCHALLFSVDAQKLAVRRCVGSGGWMGPHKQ